MPDLTIFIILEMFIILHSFLNVTVNAASVFSKVKFLDCLRRLFEGVLSIISTS